MKFTLLVTYVVAVLSLQSASAEDLIISLGSDGWNDIYEPDASQPVEIAKADPLRKKLFGLARPKLEKVAGKPILFNGSLRGFRNWALFRGVSEDKSGNPIAYPEFGNSDTVALFLRTVNGWVLVDYSGGHSDVFYEIWTEQYGMPAELLRF